LREKVDTAAAFFTMGLADHRYGETGDEADVKPIFPALPVAFEQSAADASNVDVAAGLAQIKATFCGASDAFRGA